MKELFDKYAEKILNGSLLVVGDNKYRICEIEMYYHGGDHLDKYAHCDPLQLEHGRFYPHRFKNGTYKSGTYKCMDIVYGDKQNNVYFGILIRSMMRITGEFFTGPCVCVREILRLFDKTEFKDFLQQYDIDKVLVLEDAELDRKPIYCGKRVGLGDKYPEYKDREYRYAINIDQIKKQKQFRLNQTC